MEKGTMTGNPAGKKPENREGLQKSFVLYDSCDICPLGVYIRLVCDDDPQALVVRGKPSEDDLAAARHRLMAEFAELSGDGLFGQVNASVQKMNMYRSGILLLGVCQRLLIYGEKRTILPVLDRIGIRFPVTTDIKTIQSKISGLIQERKIRLKNEEKRYRKMTAGGKEEKPDRGYFTRQLVSLSKYAGFRLTTDITLSEYAAYIKGLKDEVEQYKQMMNGYKYK